MSIFSSWSSGSSSFFPELKVKEPISSIEINSVLKTHHTRDFTHKSHTSSIKRKWSKDYNVKLLEKCHFSSPPQASSFNFCLVTMRLLRSFSCFFKSLDPKEVEGNFSPIPCAMSLWAVLADVCGLCRGGSRSKMYNIRHEYQHYMDSRTKIKNIKWTSSGTWPPLFMDPPH